MKKIATLFIICFVVGCSSKDLNENQIKVLCLLKASTNPYFVLMAEGLRNEAAKAKNIKVDILWPEKESNFEYQYSVLSNEAYNYDILILSPSDVEHTYKYLKELKDSRIKVILLDVGVNLPSSKREKDYFDVLIGTDNELGGRLVAEYVNKFLKKIKKVIVVGGFEYHMNAPGRITSFVKYIREYIEDVEIMSFTADYDREIAKNVVKSNLNEFMESDLIYCANDHMALGVLDALDNNDKRRPYIIGYDSILEAQQMIFKEKMEASIVQFPARMGREAIKIAFALQSGDVVPRRIFIPPKISVRKTVIDTLGMQDF